MGRHKGVQYTSHPAFSTMQAVCLVKKFLLRGISWWLVGCHGFQQMEPQQSAPIRRWVLSATLNGNGMCRSCHHEPARQDAKVYMRNWHRTDTSKVTKGRQVLSASPAQHREEGVPTLDAKCFSLLGWPPDRGSATFPREPASPDPGQ